MKKKLLLAILFVLNLHIVFAQTAAVTLRGKVLTADGRPAYGLTLSVKGTKHIAYTDKEGTFRISAPSGNSILIIRSGVSSEEQQVIINEITDKQLAPITIKEKSYELNEVVVTGQFEAQSVKNSVYNVRSINSEKIKLRGATNIQQILNTEFGFRFSNDLVLGINDVELMGMGGRNIKILLDGVPVIDRSDSRESLNQIDINTIDRIEVIEGPVSVTYGTDALAGVINIITKGAGQARFGVSARLQEETVGKEYGALAGDGLHNKNISLNWRNKGWHALAGFSRNEFGGWNVPPKTTTIQEMPFINWWRAKDQYLGNAKVGYENAKFNLWYRLDLVDERIASRTGMNPNIYVAKFPTYITNRYTHQLQSDIKLSSKLRINGVLGYTDLQRKTNTIEQNFATGTKVLSTGQGEQDIAKFNTAIFRGVAYYKASAMISFQGGFEYNRDEASANRIKGNPVIEDYALFLSSEIKFGSKISLRPGARFIKNSIYDAPPVIPSLNTKFILTDNLDFRLAYARGFRAPALRELYYDFVDASHTIYGNPNLKAEHSNSFNGSFVWSPINQNEMRYSANLSGFYNIFKNRIGFTQDPNDNTVTSLFNVGRFKTTGASLTNTFAYKALKADLGLSYIGRYNSFSEGDYNMAVPQFSWTPELFSNLIYNLPKIDASISAFFKYTGQRPGYTSDSTVPNGVKETKIGAFSWTDIMFNKNIYKRFTINAGVKNLFDVTQLSNTETGSSGPHGGGGGSVAYSYGRSYVLGLTFNWNRS